MSSLRENLKRYRLTEIEYQKACEIRGHDLQGVEWALFSALWSEHCSYKSSKKHLKKMNYRNQKCLELEGENAGVVDLGRGEKIVFKMESHNHPSFIEPFHGAATGVGGILRDIFTMGARPIALANYLCFGSPSAHRMKYLLKGVVSGISHYGNCVGVPMVTGSTQFDEHFNDNILVNAMAVGLLTDKMPLALSAVKGPGNLVVYVGSETGRDGVHGASMASESFSESSESKRPNIQIGDPFYEKLLIEACLESLEKNLMVAMQDMGAAGLTSSSFEMASKGELGLKIHLDRIPLRESNMTPEEILLSESQERMLMIVEPEKFKPLKEIFAKWGLNCVCVGEVLKEKNMRLFWQEEELLSIDPRELVERAPIYDRVYEKIEPRKVLQSHNSSAWEEDLSNSRGRFAEIYERFDQRVGSKTEWDCSMPFGVLRLPSDRQLGVCLGGRVQFLSQDSVLGSQDAFLDPYFKLKLYGFQPLAMTDCLNFGNPEKLPVMSDFVAAVDRFAELAKALDVPVISGNVSFYNETKETNIVPTPAVGMVGLRDLNSRKLWHSKITSKEQNVFIFKGPAFGVLSMEEIQSFDHQLELLQNIEKIQGACFVSSHGINFTLSSMNLVSENPQLSEFNDYYSVLVWGEGLELGDLEEVLGKGNLLKISCREAHAKS